MIDPNEKLRAEIQDGLSRTGIDAASLSREIGRSKDYIREFLSGRKRSIAQDAALKIREILLQGEAREERQPRGTYRSPPQFMNNQDLIPVYASAEGGEGSLIVSHDEIGRAPRPHVLEGVKDAYAILITGTSMVPAYKPGDRAWVNPTLPPARETDCILYAVDETGEAKATIKEMVTWTDAAWTLKQHNPAKTFKADRGIWTTHHRVVGNFRGR